MINKLAIDTNILNTYIKYSNEYFKHYDINDKNVLKNIINKHSYVFIKRGWGGWNGFSYKCIKCNMYIRYDEGVWEYKISNETHYNSICVIGAGVKPFKYSIFYYKGYLSCDEVIIKSIVE